MVHELGRRSVRKAHRDLQRKLSKLLYESDPAGMGSTVGAPPDEYAEEAEILVVRLKLLSDPVDMRRTIKSMFPNATEELETTICDEWIAFKERISQDP